MAILMFETPAGEFDRDERRAVSELASGLPKSMAVHVAKLDSMITVTVLARMELRVESVAIHDPRFLENISRWAKASFIDGLRGRIEELTAAPV